MTRDTLQLEDEYGESKLAPMSNGDKISAFFKPAPKPVEDADKMPAAKPASASAAPRLAAKPMSKGFELRFSRTSKVVEWDEHNFIDCNPSEAADAMDETRKQAKQFDSSEEDLDLAHVVWVDPAWTEVLGSVDEANVAAKKAVEFALRDPAGITPAKQEDVANGELPPGYRLPPTDSSAREAIGLGGRGTYKGSVTFFCDSFGADVWNVCVTEFQVRVVVEGDRTPVASSTAAAGKASAGKSVSKPSKAAPKQRSTSKASAPRTTAVAKGKPRGGASIAG